MNEGSNHYNINYTFNIQSVEDFYNQLNQRSEEILKSYEYNGDVTLANQMLKEIGVNCG